MVRKAFVIAAFCTIAATPVYAEWKYSETIDAMSDGKYARSFVEGDTGRVGIKCDKQGADSLYIHYISNNYLGGRGGSYGTRNATYRFDQDAPITTSWSYEGKSALLTNNEKVASFIARLATAKRLAIRVSDYQYGEYTTVLDVTGAASEIKKVGAACGAITG